MPRRASNCCLVIQGTLGNAVLPWSNEGGLLVLQSQPSLPFAVSAAGAAVAFSCPAHAGVFCKAASAAFAASIHHLDSVY